MTRDQFNQYLLFVAVAFGILGVVNLFRPNKMWIGIGSILFGAAALLYRQGLQMMFVGAPIAGGLVCLGLQAKGHNGRKTA